MTSGMDDMMLRSLREDNQTAYRSQRYTSIHWLIGSRPCDYTLLKFTTQYSSSTYLTLVQKRISDKETIVKCIK